MKNRRGFLKLSAVMAAGWMWRKFVPDWTPNSGYYYRITIRSEDHIENLRAPGAGDFDDLAAIKLINADFRARGLMLSEKFTKTASTEEWFYVFRDKASGAAWDRAVSSSCFNSAKLPERARLQLEQGWLSV